MNSLSFRFVLAAAALVPGACIAGAPSADVQVQVELQGSVIARGPKVLLGDVAVVRSEDLPMLRKVMRLNLGDAPPVGEERTLQRHAVARWIHLQLGLPFGQVHWVGPDQSQVRTVDAPTSFIQARPTTSPTRPVPTAQTESRLTVARGHWVSLHMQSGSVALQARAQALEDGAIGEVIQVRATTSASPVAARVVAPGRVEAVL